MFLSYYYEAKTKIKTTTQTDNKKLKDKIRIERRMIMKYIKEEENPNVKYRKRP